MKRWTEDLRAWATSLRFSGFTVLVVVLVLAGTVIVSPTLSAYIQQQREIAELRESVRQHQDAVTEIDAERVKWQDPVYVRSQARDRLFYVMPGETQLNVIDDIVLPAESTEETNAELARISGNWASGLVSSLLVAGTTEVSGDELAGTSTVPAGEETTPPAEDAEAPADNAEVPAEDAEAPEN